MIVCDNVPARERTASALAAHGWPTVIEAADPDFALELLVSKPEIRATVISAEQRSLLSGFDLARVVVDHWPTVDHVIVIGPAPAAAQVPPGARYITRPVDLDMVLGTLRGPSTRAVPGGGDPASPADPAA